MSVPRAKAKSSNAWFVGAKTVNCWVGLDGAGVNFASITAATREVKPLLIATSTTVWDGKTTASIIWSSIICNNIKACYFSLIYKNITINCKF